MGQMSALGPLAHVRHTMRGAWRAIGVHITDMSEVSLTAQEQNSQQPTSVLVMSEL